MTLAALHPLDGTILVAYLLGMVGIGVWFSRKARSGSDAFMAAGRSLPGWAVGLSIFGTFVSSISFLANPGKSYSANWNPFVFGLSLPLAAWFAARWFVPHYRAAGHVSAYEHLEARFGPWARTYAVVCYLLTQMARMGTILYLVALAVSPLIDMDVKVIILVTGVLVTAYTLLGGIEAVIWTDAIQSVVLTVGALLTCILLVNGMPEGFGQIVRIGAAEGKWSLGDFSSLGLTLAQPTFWLVLVYGLFINLQNFGIDQSYVQRYITAKSEQDARRSVWLGALLYLPISALLFFVGTALYAYYQVHPGLLPAEGLKADAVFPHFISTGLPVGVTGLLLAAILAAAMSSVDSSLNSSASLILCDIYKRYIRPDADEKASMRVLTISTLAWGVVGTLMALLMIRAKSALDTWWNYAGLFSGGMLGLFLLGFISRKANNLTAALSTAFGVLVIAWLALSPGQMWPQALDGLRSPFHSHLTIVFGTSAILLGGLLLTRLLNRPKS